MKGTEESLARVDSSVPLISWINDLFSGFPIETHSKFSCGEGRKSTGSGFTGVLRYDAAVHDQSAKCLSSVSSA